MNRFSLFLISLQAFASAAAFGSGRTVCADSLAVSTKECAERLLLQWTDALLSYQIRERSAPVRVCTSRRPPGRTDMPSRPLPG